MAVPPGKVCTAFKEIGMQGVCIGWKDLPKDAPAKTSETSSVGRFIRDLFVNLKQASDEVKTLPTPDRFQKVDQSPTPKPDDESHLPFCARSNNLFNPGCKL